MEKLQALRKVEPDDVFLNFSLAMEHAKLEQWAESVAQFDRTIALDPNYVAAYFHKGKTLVLSGDLVAARSALTTGIDRARTVGDAHAEGEMSEFLASL
jgi:tetratricopeptide (TPR) repeat protein